MRVLILNGPNLNLLGTREPEVYGRETLPDIEARIRKRAATLRVEVEFRQTNYEGDLIQAIQSSQKRVQGIILNAGGYTHTSVGILDAIIAVDVPVLEVHLSNIYAREEFRRTSLLSSACVGQITGLGPIGYELALIAIINYRPPGAEKIETVETEVREEKRARRARPRGGRGRGRQRTEIRPPASDRTAAADEAKPPTEKRKPEKEEEVDVTERYKHLEGVVVRRGVDVLEGPEPDDSALSKGSGSVSFSSDETNQEAPRESTVPARSRRQAVSSPSRPSKAREPAARTQDSPASATIAFRSAHAPAEAGKEEAASEPAASPAPAREKSKPAAAKSPRKRKAPAAKKTPRAKSPSTRSRAKKSKS